MNWVDLLLLLVVAASVATGFAAGFARVGVGFIAALVGIFAGFWSYGIVGAYFLDYVSSKAIANLIGFFLIFVVVLVAGAIIGSILAKFLKWIGLSWFDRLLGGAFGLVRGAIIAAALVTVLLAFAPSPPPRSVVSSRLMPYVIDVADVLAAMTPHEIKDAFHDTRDRVKRMWSEEEAKKLGSPRKE